MDKTKVKKLIECIAVVVIIIGIILYACGMINELACIITFFAVLGVCTGFLIYVERTGADISGMDEMKFRQEFKKKKVLRTREGNIFELATALILVVSLFLGFVNHTFELWSDNLVVYIILFLTPIALLIQAYRPSLMVIPKVSIPNDEQIKLRVRENRIEAIISALMALSLSISPLKSSSAIMFIVIGLMIAFIVTRIIFSILVFKNK